MPELIAVTEVIDGAQRMVSKGVLGSVSIDWAAMQKHKRSFTDPVLEHRA